MSYNGSGTFTINSTGQPVVAGTVITASAFNALTTDLATGLTTAITKDGQTTTTARITFAQGITSSLTTDSSSTSTGSIITAGGAGIAKNLYVGGIASFSAQPIFTSLTASSAVATDASKGLVSVTNTGTGNNVLATAPTIASLNLTTALTIASASGTVGQVLTSGGSGGAPTWSSPSTTSISNGTSNVTVNSSGGTITAATNGTTAITVDTSQNVGIGVASSLTGKLSVGTVSYGQTSPVAQVNGASKAISNNGGIFSIGSTDAAGADIGGSLGFTANSAGNGYATGQISGRKVNGSDYSSYMAFTTCDSGGTLTEKMRLNTTGALVLAGGSTSASGIGITFPATQSASSDANTLDDYEEGTFTPTIYGGTTAGSTTYVSRNGAYTKIGRVVYFIADVDWSAQTGTGDLVMGGLPFTANSTNSNLNYSSNNLTLAATSFTSLAQVNASSTAINFYQNPIGGGGLSPVSIDSSARIWISGSYFTA